MGSSKSPARKAMSQTQSNGTCVIQNCLSMGVHPNTLLPARCAVGVPYASSRCELNRAFSIPRQKCFRAGFVWGNSLKRNGERGRNRTFNLLIKSQLLCQLSYAPFWTLRGRLSDGCNHDGRQFCPPDSARTIHTILGFAYVATRATRRYPVDRG